MNMEIASQVFPEHLGVELFEAKFARSFSSELLGHRVFYRQPVLSDSIESIAKPIPWRNEADRSAAFGVFPSDFVALTTAMKSEESLNSVRLRISAS